MSAIDVVLKRIYAVLNADSTLLNLVEGIYSKVPEATKFPYIEIGESNEAHWNTFSKKGKEITISLHIYDSDAQDGSRWGYKRVLEIVDRIETLLDYVTFTVTGYTTTYIRCETTNTITGPDGKLRHGIMRFEWKGLTS